MSPLDVERLGLALLEAERSIGLSDPNPRVGCVIGFDNGQLLGQGHTQEVGGPHAEVMALRDAAAAGGSVQGATAWVTLEPCSHHGRTPPCCEALIAAGIRRVVAAVEDPHPLVAGKGFNCLRASGIDVQIAGTALADAARDLNIGYFSRVKCGKPWVRIKTAMSLDGRTALRNGSSQWITGESARHDGHTWRRRAGAILTGIGTLLQDDPRLDVRGIPIHKQPLRVVVDSQWRTSTTARLITAPGASLLVGVSSNERQRSLRDAGAQTLRMPGRDGRVDLSALIAEMSRREVNELHVEAGATLNAALLLGGHVDELLVYVAPRLFGEGFSMANLGTLSTLAQGLNFRFGAIDRLDGDIRIRLFVAPEVTMP